MLVQKGITLIWYVLVITTHLLCNKGKQFKPLEGTHLGAASGVSFHGLNSTKWSNQIYRLLSWMLSLILVPINNKLPVHVETPRLFSVGGQPILTNLVSNRIIHFLWDSSYKHRYMRLLVRRRQSPTLFSPLRLYTVATIRHRSVNTIRAQRGGG